MPIDGFDNIAVLNLLFFRWTSALDGEPPSRIHSVLEMFNPTCAEPSLLCSL